MNITVITKSGSREEYVSGQDAASKQGILDSISQTFTNDDIDKIEVQYDDIDTATLDGKRTTEPGAFVSIGSLEELKAELGKYTG